MQDQQIKECLPRVVPQGYLFIVFFWVVGVWLLRWERKKRRICLRQRHNDTTTEANINYIHRHRRTKRKGKETNRKAHWDQLVSHYFDISYSYPVVPYSGCPGQRAFLFFFFVFFGFALNKLLVVGRRRGEGAEQGIMDTKRWCLHCIPKQSKQQAWWMKGMKCIRVSQKGLKK